MPPRDIDHRRVVRWTAGIALALLSAVPAGAATFTVGSDPACTHRTTSGGSIAAALNAAEFNPGPDTIAIATNAIYQDQALQFASHPVTMSGGWADCSLTTRIGNTELHGSATSGTSVLTIQDQVNVTLDRLTLREGNAAVNSARGGGLTFSGSGVVRLFGVHVVDNRSASAGGGVFVSTQSGAPTGAVLELHDGTRIERNQAVGAGASGGGIYAINAVVRALGDDIRIADNRSDSEGGGIYAGGATLVLGSSTPTSAALLLNNQAALGGAIFADGGTLVRLVTVDPQRPTRIVGNRASSGGAFYFANGSELRAWDIVVDGNRSLNDSNEHAAALTLVASEALFERDLGVGSPPAEAVNCAPGVRCNLIEGNLARNQADSSFSLGASLAYLQSSLNSGEASLRLNGTTVRGNVGGYLVSDTCHPFQPGQCSLSLILVGTQVSANAVPSGTLFNLRAGTSTAIDLSSIVDAQPGGASTLFLRGGNLNIVRSILYNPDGIAINDVAPILGTSVVLGHSIVHETSFMPPLPPTVLRADPGFVDATADDLQLAANSPAVDYAPVDAAAPRDIDLAVRGIDEFGIVDRFGPIDLGARERPPSAQLFMDGFEQ